MNNMSREIIKLFFSRSGYLYCSSAAETGEEVGTDPLNQFKVTLFIECTPDTHH
jgi:hypothetical protein